MTTFPSKPETSKEIPKEVFDKLTEEQRQKVLDAEHQKQVRDRGKNEKTPFHYVDEG